MLKLDHLAINCQDAEIMVEFYTRLLNANADNWQSWRRGECAFPSVRLSPHCRLDLLPPPLWQTRSGQPPVTPNLHHFALALSQPEWQQACERLREMGGSIERGPETLRGAGGDGIAVYLRDPENNRVELRYYPD